jgi:hypothetical protein
VASPIIRRAREEDVRAIVQLTQENLRGRLVDGGDADGFLSIALTEAEVREANRNLAVLVAESGGRVIGYVFATHDEWSARFPLLRQMQSLYPTTLFFGRAIVHLRRFVYGPVCVARDARGSGVLQALFAGLLAEVTGRYDLGLAFADEANPRSLQAHVRKLGMQVLRSFEFDGRSYHLLAFPVPSARR